MKTQLETVGAIKRKITVDLPVERVAAALEKAYQRVQKKAKMHGFREGKVPRNLLEMHFRPDAEAEAMEILVSDSYPEALTQQAIVPVSRPQVEAGKFQKDSPFSYSATFSVHPTVEVKDYGSLSLEKTDRTVTDELVEKRLAAIQQSMTQLEPAPDEAQLENGKVGFVDFKGTADGHEFKGSKAENFLIDIGAGSLLPALEEKLIGMKKGENRHVEFDYPKDYFNKDLVGKYGVFDVTMKELKIKRVPELNDDFAKDMGSYKNMKEVRADIRKRMESAVEHEAKRELTNQAIDILVKKHQFEIPEDVVIAEIKGMFESFVRQLTTQGKKFEDTGIKPEQFIEQYKPAAENRVRGYYILSAIAKAENLTVTDEEVEARFKEIAANINQPIEKIKEYYANQNVLNGLKDQILHEKTLDFVVTKAKIKTKKAKTK